MTPAPRSPAVGRRTGPPRGLLLLGWVSVATLITLSKFAPRRPHAPLGPPGGRLAEGLPALPGSTLSPAVPSPAVPSPPSPTAAPPAPVRPSPPATPPSAPRPSTPTPPSPLARPVRILAEVESTFVADAAADAEGRAPAWRRELPRPFAELRRTASPLIMPRLELPRVLAPNFVALRGLAARARPGQAVQVRLTAYCLNGRTRQGTMTRAGIVAADTRIFPLSRSVHLYAAGRYLGRFRVEDTGGGVRGPHIDIWTPDCADARKFGSRAGVASLARLDEE